MTHLQDNAKGDCADDLVAVDDGSVEDKTPAMSKRALVRRALEHITGCFGVKQVREVLNHHFPGHSKELSENQLRSILSNLACRRIIGLRRNKAGRSPAVYETLQRSEPPFDIFRGLPNDVNAVWVATVSGLVNAREAMEKIATVAPGPYFVSHLTDHTVLAMLETVLQQNTVGGAA